MAKFLVKEGSSYCFDYYSSINWTLFRTKLISHYSHHALFMQEDLIAPAHIIHYYSKFSMHENEKINAYLNPVKLQTLISKGKQWKMITKTNDNWRASKHHSSKIITAITECPISKQTKINNPFEHCQNYIYTNKNVYKQKSGIFDIILQKDVHTRKFSHWNGWLPSYSAKEKHYSFLVDIFSLLLLLGEAFSSNFLGDLSSITFGTVNEKLDGEILPLYSG